jgi:hypothetical protein
MLLSFPALWPSFAAWTNVSLLLIGTVLFGAGFSNATSMPPLVAQREFFEHAQPGVRNWSVGSGCVRRWCRNRIFIAAALVQGIAICAFLLGRSREPRPILVTMSKSSARAEWKRTVRPRASSDQRMRKIGASRSFERGPSDRPFATTAAVFDLSWGIWRWSSDVSASSSSP